MRSILVLDVSAAVGAVRPSSSAAGVLRLCGEASSITAPSLFVQEVANGHWKYVANGSLLQDEAAEALGEALGLVDLLVPDRDLVEEAFVAAAKYRHPVYDLLYAVLARRNGAAVLTLDERLRALLAKMGVDVLPAG